MIAAQKSADHRLRVERHADDPGRGDRHLIGLHARGHRAGALHLGRVVEPAPAGRGVGVARVGDDGADRAEVAALLGHQHRRGQHAGAGEARGARRLGRVADEQRDVLAAAWLDPRGNPGGAESPGQPAGRVLAHAVGHRDPARGEEALRRLRSHCSPIVSS
jgi:hypothetical protein